jgi:hypothetical protein
MLATNLIAALAIGGLAAVGAMANEATHGGVSEMMGMGHHHMADVGGYHCASHMDEHGEHHMEHMHEEHPMDHDSCPGGSGMHDMDDPMMPGMM